MLTKQNLWSFIPVGDMLCINGTVIEHVDTFNFLGLHISHDLKWKTHIQTLSQKLSKITGILHRQKEEYYTSILKSIYNTLMLPHRGVFNAKRYIYFKSVLLGTLRKLAIVLTLNQFLSH